VPPPYSAGSIFLSVVPSFRGVPEQIREEFRKMAIDAADALDKPFEDRVTKSIPKAVEKAGKAAAEAAGKAGEESGKKYAGKFDATVKSAVASLNKSLPTIQPKIDDKSMNAQLKAVARNLAVLTDSKKEIGMELNPGTTFELLTKIESDLRDIQDRAGSMDLRVNAADMMVTVAKARGELESLNGIQIEPELKLDRQMGEFERTLKNAIKGATDRIPPVTLTADSSDVEKEIKDIRQELFELGDKDIGIDIDAGSAFLRLGQLQSRLQLVSDGRWGIDISVDAAAAAAQLAGVLAMVEKLDNTEAEIDIDVDGKAATAAMREISREVGDASRRADDGANSFRAFNARVLGIAAIGPAVIPVLGILAASIGGLLPLLAVGGAAAGVFALGVVGIGDAVGAMGDAQKDAAADSAAYNKAVTAATAGVRDAERGLAAARRDAGESAEQANRRVMSALQGVQDAERDLSDAQRDARQAQADLTEARREAADQAEKLALRGRDNLLDARQAQLDLNEAQADYDAALAEGVAGDALEQLSIDLDRARLRMDQVAETNGDIAFEQQKWIDGGVEGSDVVVAAQERVEEANRRVGDQERALAEANVAVAEARAEQSRAAVEANESIRDAQEQLAEAQLAYTDAVTQTSTAQDKLAESMAALSPAGQSFAAYLFSLKPLLDEFRERAQEGLLPGLQTWMQAIIGTYGPQFLSIVSGMSAAIGGMFAYFGEVLQQEPFRQFFDMVERSGPAFIGIMGEVLGNLGLGVASLIAAMEPLGFVFGQWLVDATAAFANWADNLAGSEGLKGFMEFVERVGPKVGEFFEALLGAIIAIVIALAPFGEDLLEGFTAFLNWIADMDTEKLGAIVIGIVGLTIAFQTIVGLNALIQGFATVVSLASVAFGSVAATAPAGAAGLVGWSGAATGATAASGGLLSVLGSIVIISAIVVVAIGLIGLALYLLWQNSETFRDIVTAVWDAVQWAAQRVADFFMTYVWPIMQQVWGFIAETATRVWNDVLKPIFDLWVEVFGYVMNWMKYAWDIVGKPLWDLIVDVVKTVWETVLQPIFGLIGFVFADLWSTMTATWNAWGKPLFDGIIAIVSWLWREVFDPIMRLLLEAFSGFVYGVDQAWQLLLKPVFEAFGAIVEGLVLIFQGSFDGVKMIWDALVGLFLNPVRFVVETVLNKGIIAGINWIASKFGAGEQWIDPVPTGWIGEAQQYLSFNDAPGRATGGPIPGSSPTKTADNIPIWATAGEFMQPVDSVEYYGTNVMEAMRKRLIPKEMFQGLASGGLVALGRRLQQMGGKVSRHSAFDGVTPTSGHGKTSKHYTDDAIDVNTRPGTSALEQRELAPMAALARSLGFRTIFMSAGHFNHLHVDTGKGDSIGQTSGETGASDPGLLESSSIWGKIGDFVSGPVDFLKGIATKAAEGLADSPLLDMLVNIPMRIAEKAAGSLMDLLGNMTSIVDTTRGEEGESLSVTENKAAVRGIAAQRKWDSGAEWTALDKLIQKESGWRNAAQNPTSTAYGLFQFLNSTWGTTGYAKTSIPSIQAQAGLQYIANRYGSPTKAWAFHQANNWYSEGGEVKANQQQADGSIVPDLHDLGGWIHPGLNVIMNRTGRPEPVFNPEQFDNIQALADGGRGGPMIGSLSLPMVAANPHEAVDEVVHQLRVYSDQGGGRYRDLGD